MEHYYSYDQQSNSMKVVINSQTELYLDPKDLQHIHFTKSKYSIPKWFIDENKHIYTADTNYNKSYLLEIVYGYSLKEYDYIFKDKNMLNYKSDNILLQTKVSKNIPYDNIEILEEFHGHIKTKGKCANKRKNPYWKVKENDDVYYIMYCDTNAYTKFSLESIDKIMKVNGVEGIPTWSRMKNGYIGAHVNNTIMHLHAWLMNHYGHGQGQKSVDHINRNKLDNRLSNLRIVDQATQNRNTGKRNRKKNAQPLPKELGGIELPKYVTYNKEKITKKNGDIYYRDFFRIEKHQKLDKCWSSTKSINVGIIQKLEMTKNKLCQINNNIVEDAL